MDNTNKQCNNRLSETMVTNHANYDPGFTPVQSFFMVDFNLFNRTFYRLWAYVCIHHWQHKANYTLRIVGSKLDKDPQVNVNQQMRIKPLRT